MKRTIRKQLRNLRLEELRKASSKIISNRDADITGSLTKIKQYDTLLSGISKTSKQQTIVAAITLVLCVAVAGWLWATPVSHTKVFFTIESAGVVFQYTEPFNWAPNTPVLVKGVTVEGVESVEASPMLGVTMNSLHKAGWIHIPEGDILVNKLRFQPLRLNTETKLLSQIEIQLFPGRLLSMSLTNSQFRSELLVSGYVRIEASNQNAEAVVTYSSEVSMPENVTIKASGSRAIPTTFATTLQEDFVLRNLHVEDLRFARESSLQEKGKSFVSTIENGVLTFPSVGRNIELGKNAQVTFVGLDGRIEALGLSDNLELVFKGEARRVLFGPSDSVQDVTPRYLEYFYKSEPLGFLWGAIVFLWSVLWGTKRLLLQ